MDRLVYILYGILIYCLVLCLNVPSIWSIAILNILYYRILLTISNFQVVFGILMSCHEENMTQVRISCKLSYPITIIDKIEVKNHLSLDGKDGFGH